MTKQRRQLLSLIFVLLVLAIVSHDVYAQSRAETIEQRAKEIVNYLSEKPQGVGAAISDRQAWNNVAERFDKIAKIKEAEVLLETPIPELPEELYFDYYNTGNRDRYQKVRNQKYNRLKILAIAECFENQGRFIPAMEELIRSICADPSWVLPAHDSNGGIYKNEFNYIDLVSSATSCELATADYWLQDKLAPEVRQLIRDNVERRTFSSYEASVKDGEKAGGRGNSWLTTTNNWNAVCHAGVLGAALALIDDPARRAWYIASAEKHSEFFLRGFTKDGYCSEGIGYWNYGFGHYVDMGETILQATDEKVNFFEAPLVREISLFGPRMQIAPEIYAAYADCTPGSTPSEVILCYMNHRLGLGLQDYQKMPYEFGEQGLTIDEFGLMQFDNTITKKKPDESQNTNLNANVELGLRSEFVDAGIIVCRAKDNDSKRLAFSAKAGHNAEHHNHNDVGSYVVALGGGTPLVDPGGEVYTKRTFSSNRYDSNVINSFGHPVPRINGQLQQTGRTAEGIVFEKHFVDAEDKIAIDLTKTYPVEGLSKATRTFFFNREDTSATGGKHPGGNLIIIDKIELEKAVPVETALITFDKVTVLTNSQEAENFDFLIGNSTETAVRVSVCWKGDVSPQLLKLEQTEIDEDTPHNVKPKRIAFSTRSDTKNVEIVTVITPAPKSLLEKYFPVKAEDQLGANFSNNTLEKTTASNNTSADTITGNNEKSISDSNSIADDTETSITVSVINANRNSNSENRNSNNNRNRRLGARRLLR